MKLADLRGLSRSIWMYYGVPGQARRLHSFYRQFVRPGDLCFDVGAHVGNRMRVWLRMGARVVALEPQPAFYEFLQWAYGRNRRLELLNAAAGAARGETTMLVSHNAPTVSSLSADWVQNVKTEDATFSWVEWDAAVTVRVVTLDELIERYGLPAFIKIDVEGFELDVLKGLSQPVQALSFEYLRTMLNMAEDCLRLVEGLGDYEFNATVIESTWFVQDKWVDGKEILRVLHEMPENATSGDVYARLRNRYAAG